MRPPVKGYISDQEASYIGLLLDHVDPRGKENGLERLCAHYRRGFRLRNPHRVRQSLNGLLYNDDANVRRWALNAIALTGTRSENLQATLDAIGRDRGNEDILGAGIAALVSLTQPDDLIELLSGIGVPLEGATLLAAAQQTDVYTPKLAANRIRVDRASDSELRLAAVLIGLNKAPEHLFEPSHENRAVIGSLNSHHDRSVAQYSVWAICENAALGVSDLGIQLADIESLPDNVRGYVLRLVAADADTAKQYLEYLVCGSEDPSEKARLGLATGLRQVYFDGLEGLTVDWFGDEASEVVKDHLLDHMAAHADNCPAYREAVVTAYTFGGIGSLVRSRLEAAAAKTSVFADLRRIAIRGDTLSLFGEADFGAKNVNQFNAQNINIGTVAGDNAKIENAIGSIQNNAQGAQEVLGLLAGLLSKSAATGGELSYGTDLVTVAQKEPSKITLEKVVDWMKSIKDGGNYALAAGHEFHEIYDKLHAIVPHLSS